MYPPNQYIECQELKIDMVWSSQIRWSNEQQEYKFKCLTSGQYVETEKIYKETNMQEETKFPIAEWLECCNSKWRNIKGDWKLYIWNSNPGDCKLLEFC